LWLFQLRTSRPTAPEDSTEKAISAPKQIVVCGVDGTAQGVSPHLGNTYGRLLVGISRKAITCPGQKIQE
jgi:hypothetical protein